MHFQKEARPTVKFQMIAFVNDIVEFYAVNESI